MQQRIFIETLMKYAVIAPFTNIMRPKERGWLVALHSVGRHVTVHPTIPAYLDSVPSRPAPTGSNHPLLYMLYFLRSQMTWFITFARAVLFLDTW